MKNPTSQNQNLPTQVPFFEDFAANAVIIAQGILINHTLGIFSRPADYPAAPCNQAALAEASAWVASQPIGMPWALVIPKVWSPIKGFVAILAWDGKELRVGWVLDDTFAWVLRPNQVQDEIDQFSLLGWNAFPPTSTPTTTIFLDPEWNAMELARQIDAKGVEVEICDNSLRFPTAAFPWVQEFLCNDLIDVHWAFTEYQSPVIDFYVSYRHNFTELLKCIGSRCGQVYGNRFRVTGEHWEVIQAILDSRDIEWAYNPSELDDLEE